MGASGYARVLPYARIVLSRLLTVDRLKEVMQSRSVEEVAAALRDSLYPGAGEARRIEDLEEAVWRGYFGVLEGIRRLAPEEAWRPLRFFVDVEEFKDVLVIAQAVSRGGSPPGRLPSYYAPESRSLALARALEENPGSKLQDVAPDPEIGRILEEALAFEKQIGIPGGLLLYYAKAVRVAAEKALDSVGAAEKRLFSRVVCPRIRYILVSTILEAKAAGVEARHLDAVMGGPRLCGLEWGSVRGVYEREEDFYGLAGALREYTGWKLEGDTLGRILESAKSQYRREARAASEAAVASYPMQPGFLAGVIELVRLEAEDVVLLSSAVHLSLKPEEVAGKLSVENVL